MSLKSSYMEMATKVGQRLGVAPLFIQFYKCQPYKDAPAYNVKFEPESDLLTILAASQKPIRNPYKLFYQVLGIPVTELEHKKQFKLLYYNNSGTEIQPHADQQERELVFYVNKAARITIRDLLNEMAKVLNNEKKPPGNLSGRNLRLVEVSSHRVVQIVDDEMSSDMIQNNNTMTRYFRAEEIPEDEAESHSNTNSEMVVAVAHFHKEARSTFGTPFLIKVRFGETWNSVKSRLQSKLGVNDKDWSKMRVALVQAGTVSFLDSEEYGDMPVKPEHFASSSNYNSHTFSGKPWIGIEHVNKAPKRSRYSNIEKAIKIYN